MNENLKHPAILRSEDTVLLVVDVQEKILKAMKDHISLLESIVKLIKGIKILKLPIFYTEQYPKGLGYTVKEISNELDSNAIQKLSFSCSGAGDLFERLRMNNAKQIIVCGIESHVCVQQTVLDLLANGFNVNVPVNAVSSRFEIDFNTAIKRMAKHGAEITTVESVLFELLNVCTTQDFKDISKLIK